MSELISYLLSHIPQTYPDSKVHGANLGTIWGRQDPGGPHVGPVNIDILVVFILSKHLVSTVAGHLSFNKMHFKCCLWNISNFVQASIW